MANQDIKDLAALTGASVDVADLFPIWDDSASITKNITRAEFIAAINALIDHGTLTGKGDDDHTLYALASGTRGAFMTNYKGGQGVVDIHAGGSSRTADLASSNCFNWTLDSSNCAITLANPGVSGVRSVASFTINQAAAGGTYNRTISFVTSITWIGGTAAQALTGQSAVTLFSVWTDDGGTTWYGAFDPLDVRRAVTMKIGNSSTAITTGDGKDYWRVPALLNGWRITGVAAHMVHNNSASGTIVTIQIANVDGAVDVLTTKLTIDNSEADSSTAATPAVINTSNATVTTGQMLRVDFDAIGSGPSTEVQVELIFSPPA